MNLNHIFAKSVITLAICMPSLYGAEKAPKKREQTLLQASAMAGHADVVQQLLSHGHDVNIQDKTGNTALHYAAEQGNGQIVTLLLTKKADATIPNDAGKTALKILKEKKEAVKKAATALLKHVSLIDVCTRNGHCERTNGRLTVEGKPIINLCIVSKSPITDLTRLLTEKVEQDALNQIDADNGTPLHYAAFCGNIDAAKLFIERGARVDIPNALKLTPLQISLLGNCPALTDLIARQVNDPALIDQALRHAEEFADPEILKQNTLNKDVPVHILQENFQANILNLKLRYLELLSIALKHAQEEEKKKLAAQQGPELPPKPKKVESQQTQPAQPDSQPQSAKAPQNNVEAANPAIQQPAAAPQAQPAQQLPGVVTTTLDRLTFDTILIARTPHRAFYHPMFQRGYRDPRFMKKR